MATFPEATARLFKDIYVCRKCESKIRSTVNKFLTKKVVCRACKSKDVRPVRLKSKK